jgi:hypothetical protein
MTHRCVAQANASMPANAAKKMTTLAASATIGEV